MANTRVFIEAVERGYIGHAITPVDGAGKQFMAVAKARPENSNITFIDVYEGRDMVFGAHPIGESIIPDWPLLPPDSNLDSIEPGLKTDVVFIVPYGTGVQVSMTTHEPKEAPRRTRVEGAVIPNVWTPVVSAPPPAPVDPPEPCVLPNNLPYFRPNKPVTRAQVAKMIAIAAGLEASDPTHQSFQDIPVGSTFHLFVEAMREAGAISGYPCVP